MAKILIFGGLGYVGSVATKHLADLKHEINIYDSNWFQYKGEPSGAVKLTKQDVRKISDKNIFKDVDAVVYLSALSNDPMGNRFEGQTNEINHLQCVRLALSAKEAGVKKFVFASSCSIYGLADTTPRTESCDLNPLTAYARSKVAAEQNLEPLADDEFTVIALRFSTACGASPNLRLDLVFNDFVAAGLFEGKIQILSNGEPWRPLIHVNDMARAIEWACTTNDVGMFCAVNVGSDEWTFKIRDLANRVADVLGGVDISINTEVANDDRSYVVNFDKFKALAPDHQPISLFSEAVLELSDQLSNFGFSKKQSFRGAVPFFRLKTLVDKIETKKMDENLYWNN